MGDKVGSKGLSGYLCYPGPLFYYLLLLAELPRGVIIRKLFAFA